MGILSSILGISPEKIIDSASGFARIFVGDKSQKESNIHDEQIAASEALEAEAAAQSRENRNAWDSAVDGINRLVRPTLAFGVIGILVWCPINPQSFANAMISYQLVPEWLALGFAQVLALFMGGRMLKDWTMKPVDPKITASVLAQLKATNPPQKEMVNHNNTGVSQSAVEPLSSAKDISDKEYKKEMQDTSRPLSLDSLVKWNALNAKN